MSKKIALACLPLLLFLLLPFQIPLGSFFYTLEKYGTVNRFLVPLSLGSTALLLFDLFLRDGIFTPPVLKKLALATAFLFSLLLRLAFFDFESQDYREALSMWFDTIRENGGFQALALRNFSDYNSTYLYLMASLTYLPIHKLYSIKAASVLFDYMAAFWVYKLVRLKYPSGNLPILAAFCLLFAPTVLFNGSLWAQCDVIYTAFLLWAAYRAFTAQSNFLPVVVLWAIALMFKLQAVFWALPLLLLYISHRLSLWKALTAVLGVWSVTILPHFLLGRALPDLLLIYARQVVRYPELSLNAPTIFQLLPGAPFGPFSLAGILAAAACCIGFAFFFLRYPNPPKPLLLLHLSMVSVLLLPFLLPKMHERYFFAADVFAIVYAFYLPKRWWLPIGVGAVSLASYLPYLFGEILLPFPVLSLAMLFFIATALYDLYCYYFPTCSSPGKPESSG